MDCHSDDVATTLSQCVDVFSERPSEIVRKIQETIPKMKVPVHPSPDVQTLIKLNLKAANLTELSCPVS